MTPKKKKPDIGEVVYTAHPMARLRYTIDFMKKGHAYEEARRLATEQAIKEHKYAPNTKMKLELKALIEAEEAKKAKQTEPPNE